MNSITYSYTAHTHIQPFQHGMASSSLAVRCLLSTSTPLGNRSVIAIWSYYVSLPNGTSFESFRTRSFAAGGSSLTTVGPDRTETDVNSDGVHDCMPHRGYLNCGRWQAFATPRQKLSNSSTNGWNTNVWTHCYTTTRSFVEKTSLLTGCKRIPHNCKNAE